MYNEKHISSTKNPLIKKAVLLRDKSKERKKTGLFIIEGLRELEIAVKANYKITTLFYCPTLIDIYEIEKKINSLKGLDLISVSIDVYKKIAYREGTEGIVAMVKAKQHDIANLKFTNNNPLILVAEAPEKPGNIGALLRTADAANLDAVFIANPKTDLYNPNIIRSSVGCVFSRPIVMADTTEILSFLKKEKIPIYCAALSASKDYTNVSFKEASAIVVGTESTGLSEEWLSNSDQNIIIPMEGAIDSMNVSVSAAILIFEAKRQRKSN